MRHKITLTLLNIVLATLAFSFLTSCHTTKDVVRKVNTNEARKLENYLHRNAGFRTLESKVEFSMNARQGVGASMKGTVRICKDSCIILSVQPFIGIEALRCMIVKDSVIIVNRLQQIYSVERLDQFAYKDYISVSAVQDVLTNRIFVPGDPNPGERKVARFDQFRQKESEGYRWAENSFILDFAIDKDNNYNRLRAYRPEKSEQVTVNYSKFENKSGKMFPTMVSIRTEGLKQNYNMNIEYLKPQFDAGTEFHFDIPSKYKRVTTAELIQRLQNLL